MNKIAIGRSPETHVRNRRLGLLLAAVTVIYIAAVIGFLIFK